MATPDSHQRMMHINLFLMGCGHHRGAWRHPQSAVEQLGDIRYYERLAQTAERGKLDAVFFADSNSVGNVSDG
ncbi:MAG TPA: LLM class flavin-dependent oxidoreductase, partial [Marinobacter sp.]|nr:LLM class flavin-dependent oxidoreductase [Marinobacter sp.]